MQRAGQRVVENVFHERAFAAAAHAADDGEAAQWKSRVHAPQVMMPGADNFQPAAGSDLPLFPGDDLDGDSIHAGLLAAWLGRSTGAVARSELRMHAAIDRHGDRLLTGQKRPGDRAFLPGHLRWRASRHDLTAPVAGRRAKVEQLVGAGQHFTIVFDHKQGVSQIAKFLQGSDQPAIVARVQPDGRFVQHIQDAAQPAPHLAPQADPLRLAAGKRGSLATEREILEPHVDQELQPIANLAHQLAGDLLLARIELPLGKPP